MSFKHISIAETKELLGQKTEAVVADIRNSSDFASSRIPNAKPLGNDNIQQFINEHDKAQPVLVCCYHGHSSQQAAAFLVEQGFKEVYSIDGGFELWRQTEVTEN